MMALTSAALGGLDVRLLVPQGTAIRAWSPTRRGPTSTTCWPRACASTNTGRACCTARRCWSTTTWSIIGSANFDHRSFRLNFEVSLLFHDARLAGELERLVETDLAHSPPGPRRIAPAPPVDGAAARGARAAGVAAALKVRTLRRTGTQGVPTMHWLLLALGDRRTSRWR